MPMLSSNVSPWTSFMMLFLCIQYTKGFSKDSAIRNSHGVNVPVASSCHRITSGTAKHGKIKSHDGYPASAYAPGYKCRTVINVPSGHTAEVSVGAMTGNKNASSIRPWDFIILVDGSVAGKLDFICEVEKYKRLGNSGEMYVAVVQKYFVVGVPRTMKSTTRTVVVDFCTHTFVDKDSSSRKGFEIFYKAAETATLVTSHDSSGSDPFNSAKVAVDRVTTPTSVSGHHEKPAEFSCGRPQSPPSSSPNRIVNGNFARANSWPWICALVQMPSLQFCGCTVIDERWVITAGHCVDGSTDHQIKENVQVFIGVENLKMATQAHKYRILQVIRHENYNDPVGSTSNDIALLRIDRHVPISNDSMPACIPTKSVHDTPYAQKGAKGRRLCYVAGWGRLYDGQSAADGGSIGAGSDHLQQVAIEVMSDSDCKTYMAGYLITDKMFCGGYDRGKYDSCQGDSGGPMMCDDGSGRWLLYGVVSWGLGCAQPKAPGIYTNVALMRDWIHSKIGHDPRGP